VCNHDPGDLLSRIESITDLRKYKRQDAVDSNLQKANICSSIAFESLLDVGAEFHALIMNESIYFSDVNPVRRDKHTKFFFDYLGSFKTFTASLEKPRFMYEPGLLINHHISEATLAGYDFALTDDVYLQAKDHITNPQTLDTV